MPAQHQAVNLSSNQTFNHMRSICYCSLLFLFCFLNVAHAQEKPTAEDELKYQQFTKPLIDSANKSRSLFAHAKKGKWKDYNIDSLEAASEMLLQKSRSIKLAFIAQHPDSYAALYYFHQEFLNGWLLKVDSLETIYASFGQHLKATPLGQSVGETLAKKKTLLIGNPMPAFSFTTSEGKEVSLDSLRGQKYVLLCFWDSGCAPCIRSIPLMKEINAQYGNQGLQLIHVSLDNTEKEWKASLERHPMPWLQTLDLPPYIKGSKVDDLYDITFIPQYFLLDKEGKLLYHNSQLEDDDDYNKLKDILKKIVR